ncbi:MAG: dienelactone hydrolase family protein [Desulfobacterales bacterium]|jgi:dienelactone hydrolase|nr:dienelactone hydrolase family protein [Deltaproteobacteria bacterium]
MKKLFIAIYILLIATAVNAEVVSQNVEYKHEDIVLEGYLAYDDTAKGKRPGVLVVHEWWGLNDYVRMRVDKLAKLGYVAFALDMYGKGIWTDQASKAQELSGHLRGKPIMRQRARAGLEILRKNERVDPTKIAAIGYCFGGTTVLELAYSGADIAGVVSFHGGLTTPKAEDMSRIKAKILVLHGANDAFIPPEKIAAFQEGVGKAGADWQMIYYGGAVHSFTNPAADKKNINGLAYSPSADERSWKHMQLFFDEIF